MTIPPLIGVIHLQALPGSARYGGQPWAAVEACARDAAALAQAGFDAAIVENFGDAPFEPGAVEPITVAAMTRCVLAAKAAAPSLMMGVNVLRNDAASALAIAVATESTFIRVNVHTGARVTDQGIVEGGAHRTLRSRRALDAVPDPRADVAGVAILCDVDVKHSSPLGARPIEDEVAELTERGLADAVLVTGSGTGREVDAAQLAAVVRSSSRPVLVASGATLDNLGGCSAAHGVIVGSCLRASGRAGDPIDVDVASRFASAFRSAGFRTK